MTVEYEFELLHESSPPLQVIQDTGSGEHAYTLWDSSLVLAKAIDLRAAHEPDTFTNKTVLEIGSGCSLPSMVLLSSCSRAHPGKPNAQVQGVPAKLIVTDRNESILDWCKQNIERNFSPSSTSSLLSTNRLEYGILDITDPTHRDRYASKADVIIFSDMLYDSTLYEPLAKTLEVISNEGTRMFFAYEKRDFGKEVEFYRLFGLKWKFRPIRDLDERFQSEDIYVFEAWRKG
ncbi:hypothetical protein HK102_012474 [Quaeritorhiza haematococci]|nr:hypothetical protein HK102_012474 [Quaeritorhiza haematococci]